MNLGAVTFEWITPVTQGQGPAPRYLHSMSHSLHLNGLIIYGGRNNTLNEQEDPFFGDFWLLRLDTLTWVSMIQSGTLQKPRCAHSTILYQDKLLVFGGIHYNLYCSSDCMVVELDRDKVKNLVAHGHTHEKDKKPEQSALKTKKMIKIKLKYSNVDELDKHKSPNKNPSIPELKFLDS